MRRWTSRCTTGLIVCAVVASVHGQGRTRDGVVAPRAASTPSGAPGQVRVQISPQLMHLRFPKAVTAPAQLTEEQDIRAHLESPLVGTVNGSTQKAVIVPSDIDVNLSVRLTQADAQNTRAKIQVRIVSLNIDPAFGRQRFFSAEVSHEFASWPKAGDVLIPAGATLSVPHFGGDQVVGQEALTAKDPNVDRAEDSYPSRPILPVSLPIALVDTPIDVNNAGSDKLFHAQLTADMDFQQGHVPLPVGAIKLTKGTDVYLRSYEPDPSAPLGHIAVWTLAFVVVDGKRIPVRGVDIRQPFAPGSMAISPDGKRKIPMVLWPLGQTRRYLIAEQQEVMKDGSPLWTYPTTTDSASPSTVPASTQTSTEKAGTPTTTGENPSAPPARATPALPPDVQAQIDENKRRAEELKACRDQAMKEHAANPLALARALGACRDAARPRGQSPRK